MNGLVWVDAGDGVLRSGSCYLVPDKTPGRYALHMGPPPDGTLVCVGMLGFCKEEARRMLEQQQPEVKETEWVELPAQRVHSESDSDGVQNLPKEDLEVTEVEDGFMEMGFDPDGAVYVEAEVDEPPPLLDGGGSGENPGLVEDPSLAFFEDAEIEANTPITAGDVVVEQWQEDPQPSEHFNWSHQPLEPTHAPLYLSPPSKKEISRELRRYPGKTVFFRVGDRYEVFGDDAGEVGRILGLGTSERENIVLCGFPWHEVEGRVRKLSKHGMNVVLCEREGTMTGTTLKGGTTAETITAPAKVNCSVQERLNKLACAHGPNLPSWPDYEVRLQQMELTKDEVTEDGWDRACEFARQKILAITGAGRPPKPGTVRKLKTLPPGTLFEVDECFGELVSLNSCEAIVRITPKAGGKPERKGWAPATEVLVVAKGYVREESNEVEARGESGVRVTESKQTTGRDRSKVFGYSLSAVARWMGQEGWSFDEAVSVFTSLRVDFKDATVKTGLSDGRSGKWGKPAPLTDVEILELRKLVGKG